MAASQTQDQPYCTYPSLTLAYFANAAYAAHKDHLHEVNNATLSSTTLYTLGASLKSRKGSVIESKAVDATLSPAALYTNSLAL